MSHTQFHTDSGIHWDGKNWDDKYKIIHNLTSGNKPGGFGESITPEASRKMIFDFFGNSIANYFKINPKAALPEFIDFLKKENISVEFGKEALLRILTQEGCEGIRFSYCKNHKGESSIVAMGIENDKSNPGKASLIKKAEFQRTAGAFTAEDPMSEEKGHGITFSEYINENTSLTSEALFNSHRFDDSAFDKAIKEITNNFFKFSVQW